MLEELAFSRANRTVYVGSLEVMRASHRQNIDSFRVFIEKLDFFETK